MHALKANTVTLLLPNLIGSYDFFFVHYSLSLFIIIQFRLFIPFLLRIAAQTNAERVCKERGWPIGTVVGYHVDSDQRARRSEDTCILYCTTDVLLEKLIRAKSLNEYTHIVLDEVHERTKEMDFLMAIIYKWLTPTTKVVLMSATIDPETVSLEKQFFFNQFQGFYFISLRFCSSFPTTSNCHRHKIPLKWNRHRL